MHLLIGFLASALMASKKRSSGRSPLLELSYPIRTRHLLPGRVRFEIPKLVGRPGAAAKVEALSKLEGVSEVTVTSPIGTVLIRFDEATLQPELLVAALVRVLDLEREMESAPSSAAAREIRAAGTALDRAVFDRTSGLLDLSTALPLGLAGIGIYRIVTRQGPLLPTGATLLWWAFSTMRRSGSPGRENRS